MTPILDDHLPFVFAGKTVYSVEDLVELCEQQPTEGLYYLLREDIEKWFEYVGKTELSQMTREARLLPVSDADRLRHFVNSCNLSISKELLLTIEKLPDAQLEPVLEQARQREFTFVIVGRAGVGKSSTINSLMGRELASVNEFEAETMEVGHYRPPAHVIPYSVFDTPGLCDAKGNDKKYLELIHEKLKGREVDCIWFVTFLNDTRVREDEVRAVERITEAFGSKIWERAIIIFTFADEVSAEKYSERLEKRTNLIRRVIADQTNQKIALEVPSVAVSNINPRTPDGKLWLGNLFKKVLLKISEEGVSGFWLEIINWRGIQAESQDKSINVTGENLASSLVKKNSKHNNISINVKIVNPHSSSRESGSSRFEPISGIGINSPPTPIPVDPDDPELGVAIRKIAKEFGNAVNRVATEVVRTVERAATDVVKAVEEKVVAPIRNAASVLSVFFGFGKKK